MLCGPAPILVTRDPGRFLKDRPAFLGSIGQQTIDHPLLDQGVRVGTDTGSHQQILNVLEPTRMAVQQVVAITIPKHTPGDSDFGVLDRKQAVFV